MKVQYCLLRSGKSIQLRQKEDAHIHLTMNTGEFGSHAKVHYKYPVTYPLLGEKWDQAGSQENQEVKPVHIDVWVWECVYVCVGTGEEYYDIIRVPLLDKSCSFWTYILQWQVTSVSVCVCVCVSKRERESVRRSERERERERERELYKWITFLWINKAEQ